MPADTELRDAPPDAVWPEAFAELLGVKRNSIKHYLTQATRRGPSDDPADFPVPDGYAIRKLSGTGSASGSAGVRTPWWLPGTAATHKAHRRGRGNPRRKAG